jgi:hypothetical protein
MQMPAAEMTDKEIQDAFCRLRLATDEEREAVLFEQLQPKVPKTIQITLKNETATSAALPEHA